MSANTLRGRVAASVALGLAVAALAACSALGPEAASPQSSLTPSTPAAASVAPTPLPEPGRTIEATPPTEVGDLRGTRLAVVVPDDTLASQVLRDAVRVFAQDHGLVIEEFVATADPGAVDAAFLAALASEPHIVVGLGTGAVDAFAYNSSQFLDQDFLLIGAQVAEPTANIAAVVWDGATSRGSGAPPDGELEQSAVTISRADAAAAVGITSVMSGESGIVLRLGDGSDT